MPADGASQRQPVVPPPALTLVRAAPLLTVLGLAGLAPLWGVLDMDWSVLAVVISSVLQTAAAGFLAWAHARNATGPTTRPKDDVLVKEFFKTYVTIIVAATLIASMVFGGRLLRPGGATQERVYDAFSTWQYWAVVAVLVGAEVLVFLLDRWRGVEQDLPPETFVAEPLKRLIFMQLGVFVLGLVVYWRGSSRTGLIILVLVATAAVVALAATARLREARIRAALEAGAELKQARPAKTRPRAGRKRARRR